MGLGFSAVLPKCVDFKACKEEKYNPTPGTVLVIDGVMPFHNPITDSLAITILKVEKMLGLKKSIRNSEY